MISSLYTTFEKLVLSRDAKIMELFDAVTDNYSNRSAGSSMTSGNFISMITIRDHMTRNDAVSEMKRVLNIVKDPNMDSLAKFNAIQRKLQYEGMMNLFEYLIIQANEDDETIASNVVTPNDFFDSLFKGMPLFKVVVRDADTDNLKKCNDRYNIYMEDCKTGDLTLINFPNKDPKVLFLWFLINNRMPVSRNMIMKAGRDIVEIFNRCFPNSKYEETFRNKLGFDGQTFTDENGVGEFIKKVKNNGTPAIKDAIADRDDAKWYIIDFTSHKELGLNEKFYAVSLPDEFISLPYSLKHGINKISRN